MSARSVILLKFDAGRHFKNKASSYRPSWKQDKICSYNSFVLHSDF